MDWSYIAGYFDGEGTAWYRPHGKGSAKCSLAWVNTNRESIEAMQAFIGVGSITVRHKEGYKPLYQLRIERRQHLIPVVDALLTHCIIKRDALLAVRTQLQTMRDQSATHGALSQAGDAAIRRLYWDEGLNLQRIAQYYGVTWTAVRNFMRRRGIPQRSRSAAQQQAIRDPEKWAARSEKLRARRLADWSDADYRARQSALMRRRPES